MTNRSEELRKQVNELWRQGIDQLEDVKEAILRRRDRIEIDLQRLRAERDKLLKTLGEQTYKLANQGKLPVPDFVKKTVDRLNEVIDSLVEQKQRRHPVGTRAKQEAAPSAAKKTTKKKAASKKKVAKRPASKKKPSSAGAV